MAVLIVTGTCPRNGEPPLTARQIAFIRKELDRAYVHFNGDLTIVQGGADGVDSVAAAWAYDYAPGIISQTFIAEWAKYGRSAGPRRNEHMVKTTITRYGIHSTIGLGFTTKPLEQSRGTAHCMNFMERRGITTHLFRLDLFEKEY